MTLVVTERAVIDGAAACGQAVASTSTALASTSSAYTSASSYAKRHQLPLLGASAKWDARDE